MHAIIELEMKTSNGISLIGDFSASTKNKQNTSAPIKPILFMTLPSQFVWLVAGTENKRPKLPTPMEIHKIGGWCKGGAHKRICIFFRRRSKSSVQRRR